MAGMGLIHYPALTPFTLDSEARESPGKVNSRAHTRRKGSSAPGQELGFASVFPVSVARPNVLCILQCWLIFFFFFTIFTGNLIWEF